MAFSPVPDAGGPGITAPHRSVLILAKRRCSS